MELQLLSPLSRALKWRSSRRTALATLSAVGLSGARASAQSTPTDATVVGRPAPGATAFEFVGRISQEGLSFTLLGYLTYLDGIEQAELFTGTDPFARSEAQARFTLFGSATGVSRSIVDRVFAVDAEGTLDVHATADAGASFEDPASFTVGDPVCSMSLRVQDIISVYAPQQGLAQGVGEFTVVSTTTSSLGEAPVMIGQQGDAYRVAFSGQGELLDPQQLIAVIAVGGHAVLPS